ncbi:MAG: superoxide dismutase family protein [Acidimicrobiales bacterium]
MTTNRRRTRRVGLGLAAATTMLIGGAQAASAVERGAVVSEASGPTQVYGPDNPLAGVSLRIHGVQTPSGKTIVSLHAAGFDPALAGTTYGAHVHVNPCGPTGAAAGGHYKNLTLPATDVEAREIWLDFTVNPDGTAHARAQRDWVFTSSAQSVVVHALPTDLTGGAGTRLACTDAPFHP